MTRYCYMCGSPIAEERLKKSAKTKYCKDACRFGDRRERTLAKRAARASKGQCPTCGHRIGKKKQEDGNARVHEIAQAVSA